jgi:hypothetical protein
MTTFKAIRTCVFCGNRFDGRAEWMQHRVGDGWFYRCGSCTAQGRDEILKVELKHDWFGERRTAAFQDRLDSIVNEERDVLDRLA